MTEILFDYDFYLDLYPDLRHFNKEEAYNHYLTFGIKEGRKAFKIMENNETNVTIIVHLFFENLIDEILDYIKDISDVFSKVNFIFTINIDSNFDKYLKSINPLFIILKVENKGVDIEPFLRSILYLRENNIDTDFILKIHTKVSNNIEENNFNWRRDLIRPITKYNNLLVISNYFKKYKNIGFIGAQSCIVPKMFDVDFPQNIQDINELCQQFNHLEKDWTDFIGGTMFWISNSVLIQYLTTELIDYLISKFSYNKPPCNLTDSGIYVEYLCERLFTGVFCYDKLNILVNDYDISKSGLNLINNKIYYQPKIFTTYIPKNIIF